MYPEMMERFESIPLLKLHTLFFTTSMVSSNNPDSASAHPTDNIKQPTVNITTETCMAKFSDLYNYLLRHFDDVVDYFRSQKLPDTLNKYSQVI